MTIEKLREFGADVNDGLERCMNNEEFYLKMVEMSLQDQKYDELLQLLEEGDLDAAFETAHALKGVAANLALTPICAPANELTELLRTKAPGNYIELYDRMMAELERLRTM